MKFSELIPSFFRPKEVPTSVADIVIQEPPKHPLELLDEHLSVLLATETQAKAAHDAAVLALNEYMASLEQTLEVHQSSIRALYTNARYKVNVEKTNDKV